MLTDLLFPYIHADPRVRNAAKAHPDDWDEVRWNVGLSDTSYFEAMSLYWRPGSGFGLAVVEHDVVVNPSTFFEFDACPNLWCAAPYPYFVGMHAGLGCVRFHAELITAVPNLFDQIAGVSTPDHPPKHWCSMDGIMARQLMGLGYRQCLHPPVEHLGDLRPSHGCQG